MYKVINEKHTIQQHASTIEIHALTFGKGDTEYSTVKCKQVPYTPKLSQMEKLNFTRTNCTNN